MPMTKNVLLLLPEGGLEAESQFLRSLHSSNYLSGGLSWEESQKKELKLMKSPFVTVVLLVHTYVL